MHQLNDGRNLCVSVVSAAEDAAAEAVSQMCSLKWDAGEFCEPLLVGHLNFDILTWGSDKELALSTTLENSATLPPFGCCIQILMPISTTLTPSMILISAGKLAVLCRAHLPCIKTTTASDRGSMWIILIYDRELYEESDEMAKTAVVTLVVSIAVSAFAYILMLRDYASRIRNLRKTMRSIQTVSPPDNTELVDQFVVRTRIHEVSMIAKEFASAIYAMARSDEEKRAIQEKQLAERAFLAHMAHDSRTTLYGFLGTCEVVLGTTKEPETQE